MPDDTQPVQAPAPAPTPPAPAPVPALATGAPPPAEPSTKIPEKFRVMGPDGKLDEPASWLKVEEHRSSLEQRLGSGEIRPKTADDYTVTVPDAAKDTFDVNDPFLKEFRAKAHEAGFSQKQFDFAIGEYVTRLLSLGDLQTQQTAEACTAELKQTWAAPDEYKKNLSAGFRALNTYGGADAESLLAKFGNDPGFIRLMAAVGLEMKEDTPPADGAGTPPVDISLRVGELQAEIPKLHRSDPKRIAMQAELDGLFAKKFGTRVLGTTGAPLG